MARHNQELKATLEALRRELDELTARVARLEAQLVDVYAQEDEEQSLDSGVPAGPSGRDLAPEADGGVTRADEGEGHR